VGVAQTVIVESGTDLNQFPKEGNYCSWLGLAPKHEISGGKVLKNKTLKTKNRAGQAFRMAAQSVKGSDCVFGMMFRRFRAHMDNRQATVATAHAIARVVYRMLKYQVEYEAVSVEEYDAKRLLHLAEVQGTTDQIHAQESRQTRLPTCPGLNVRPGQKKASSCENACFAFNRACNFR